MRSITLALVVLVVLVAAPSQADALPACDAGTTLGYGGTGKIRFPKYISEGRAGVNAPELAIGRESVVNLNMDYDSVDVYANAVTLSFSAGPGQTISHPANVTVLKDNIPSSDDFGSLPIKFESGDGVGQITVTWTLIPYKKAACDIVTETREIDPVEPWVDLSTDYPTSRDWDDESHYRSAVFQLNTRACAGEVSFRLTVGGRSKRISSDQNCMFKATRGHATRGPAGARIWIDNDREFEVAFLRHRRETTRAKYEIKLDDEKVKSGSIRSRMSYHQGERGHKVFDTNFDRYWNLCVNSDRRVWSEGDHFYCWISGTASWWYTNVQVN